MEDSIEYFFDRKKLRQSEIRLEKMKAAKKAKQDTWAARLVPLDESTKQCCSSKCVNGCIPLPMLLKTRKVTFFTHTIIWECHEAASNLFLLVQDFLNFSDQTDRKQSLIDLLDTSSPSGFSIYQSYYPICWKGLNTFLGVSTCLLQTVQSTPAAKNRPCAKRPSRIGIASELKII